MSIIFARVACEIATLVASEDSVVCTTQKGVASCVCAVTSIQLRGTVLESNFFENSDLWTVEEVLDTLDVDGP